MQLRKVDAGLSHCLSRKLCTVDEEKHIILFLLEVIRNVKRFNMMFLRAKKDRICVKMEFHQ